MALTVSHKFVCAIPDDPVAAAAGEILTNSHWNGAALGGSHSVVGVLDPENFPAVPPPGWGTGSGGGSPAGSNKWVQFNDGGVFGADAGFTYDKATGILLLTDMGIRRRSSSVLEVNSGVVGDTRDIRVRSFLAASTTPITANAPAGTYTQTWNNAAVAFTAISAVITNTASDPASKLLDLTLFSGGSQFSVGVSGLVNIPALTASQFVKTDASKNLISAALTSADVPAAGATTQVQFNDGGAFGASANFAFDKVGNKVLLVKQNTATYAFAGDTGTGFGSPLAGEVNYYSAGLGYITFGRASDPYLRMRNTLILSWTVGDPLATADDTGLARNAAGVVEINNGTAGTFANIRVRQGIASDNLTQGGWYLSTTSYGMFMYDANTVGFRCNQSAVVSFAVRNPALGNPENAWVSGGFGFAPTGGTATGPDAYLIRTAAGILEVNSGTIGSTRDLRVRRHFIAPTTLGTVVDGALEYDGTKLWFTIGSTRNQVCPSTGGGSTVPGGADTQIQYNKAGAFAGDAGLTYNDATDTLTAGAYAGIADADLFAGLTSNLPGYARITGAVLVLGGSGANSALFEFAAQNKVVFMNTTLVGWASSGAVAASTLRTNLDTAFGRNAAGRIEVNSGTAGTFRDILARTYFVGATDTGLSRNAAGVVEVNSGVVGTLRDLMTRFTTATNGVWAGSGGVHSWTATAGATGGADTGIGRNAAGVVEVNNGALGSWRDLIVRTITFNGTDAGMSRNAAGVIEVNNGVVGTPRDIKVRRALVGPATLGLMTPNDGALEYDGAALWFTVGTTRNQIALGAAGVSSFNTRTGAVVLTSVDVTSALTYTPANRAGDTFTGFVTLNADPTAALHAATKQYVDAHGGGGMGLKTVVFTASGTFTWPLNSDSTPVEVVTVTLQAGGGGGGRGNPSNTGSKGGGGAGELIYQVPYARAGVTTTAVTINAGSAGATASGTDGQAGGAVAFGTLTALGGGPGTATGGGAGGGVGAPAGGAGGSTPGAGVRPTPTQDDIAHRFGSSAGGGNTGTGKGAAGGPCQQFQGGLSGANASAASGAGGAASIFGDGGKGGDGAPGGGSPGGSVAANGYGAGGGGGGQGSPSGNGGNGGPGVVIVQYTLY